LFIALRRVSGALNLAVGFNPTAKFKAPLTRRKTNENLTLNESMVAFFIATEIKDRKAKNFG